MKTDCPKHIAIILDGNRRYAKKLSMKPWEGHNVGFNKIEDLLGWCKELSIKELTLYCFSTENFNRDKTEVKYLFDLFRSKIDDFMNSEKMGKEEVKVRVLGRIHMFPEDMQNKMNEIMEKTKNYDKFTLNLCMAYGGRSEIVDAVKKIVKRVKENKLSYDDISEKMISENIYMGDEPDILIRPGGEKRLSNFLIWQSVYSELFFVEKLWPEFTKEDLIAVVEEYKKRQRRFGK